MFLADCNESQATELLDKARIAFLPIGATEPHGNHLPLGTDTILAERFSSLVAKALPVESVILPTLPYSQVWSLKGFAGAIDIGNDLLTELVVRLAHNMQNYNIDTVAVINTHFGNFDALKAAARSLKEEGMSLFIFSWPGTAATIENIRETKQAKSGYMHACEIETSLALALMEERVDMCLAQANYPEFPPQFAYLPIPWTEFSSTATLGDPTKATGDKGMQIVSASCQTIVTTLTEHFKGRA